MSTGGTADTSATQHSSTAQTGEPSGRRQEPEAQTPLSVGFISLGCPKNLVDSQIMAGTLVAEHVTLAPSPEEADVVIVNTCAFIEAAREESIDAILEACRHKKHGPCRAVIVTGCLPQRYRQELPTSLPEVDAFIGLDELDRIGGVLRRVAAGEHPVLEVSRQAVRLFDPPLPGLALTGGPYAYLKIAEGCNHRCTFCAIPGIRGRYRSRPVDELVAEAESLLENGFRELNLISQDVTAYGQDLHDDSNLCRLVQRLSAIGGRFWIRLLYGYPSRVSRELLEAMAACDPVCPYLDIPIQHSHPSLLKAMLRADTIEHVPDMAARIRRALPDAAVRTTCLVGFPGETEQHLEHLLQHVNTAEYDHLGAFAFSPEEGTPAFDMADRPDSHTAQKRLERLMLAQRQIVARKASARLGKETDILLHEPPAEPDGAWLGRSPHQAPEIDGHTMVYDVPPTATAGDLVRARFTEASDYDMAAKAVTST